jgi:hypothetical protein
MTSNTRRTATRFHNEAQRRAAHAGLVVRRETLTPKGLHKLPGDSCGTPSGYVARLRPAPSVRCATLGFDVQHLRRCAAAVITGEPTALASGLGIDSGSCVERYLRGEITVAGLLATDVAHRSEDRWLPDPRLAPTAHLVLGL